MVAPGNGMQQGSKEIDVGFLARPLATSRPPSLLLHVGTQVCKVQRRVSFFNDPNPVKSAKAPRLRRQPFRLYR